MIQNIALLIVGFVLLIKGADFFVDGSAAIARFFKVPGVIIGLTIVAMGTSAPELAVSVSAALSGSNAIAVSNVVGSNIFNLLVVLGICAVMKTLPVDDGIKKRDYPISLVATFVVMILGGDMILSGKAGELSNILAGLAGNGDMEKIAAGELYPWNGAFLIVLFLVYIFYTIVEAKKNPVEDEQEEPVVVWKSILFIIGGLTAIVAGGQMVVNSSEYLAAALGMSETLIGLTVVAIGTSLPELVTSVVASKKGENGMAVGNVVGSNIFNLLLILGASSVIHPIGISLVSFVDLVVLFVVSLAVYGFVAFGKKITRLQGEIMIFIYAIYITYTIVR